MKKKSPSDCGFFNFYALSASIFFLVIVPLVLDPLSVFAAAPDLAQAITPEQNATSPVFKAGVGEHVARTGDVLLEPALSSIYPQSSGDNVPQSEVAPRPPVMAPTRSSFLAIWESVNGAIGYRLDVSTSSWPYKIKAGDATAKGSESQGTSAMVLAAVGKSSRTAV